MCVIVDSITVPAGDTKYSIKCGFSKAGGKAAATTASVLNAPSVNVLPKCTSVTYPEKLSVIFTLYLGENGLYMVIMNRYYGCCGCLCMCMYRRRQEWCLCMLATTPLLSLEYPYIISSIILSQRCPISGILQPGTLLHRSYCCKYPYVSLRM